MDAVDLLNLDDAATDLLLASPDAFESRYRLTLGGYRKLAADVAQETRKVVAPRTPDPRWWGYLALHPRGRLVLGTCGFRAGPTEDGAVEIAYFTFPGLEGQGIATAMARALLGIAFESPGVGTVVAHTLPRSSASTRVLEKLGFALLGAHLDREDGRVWRWQLARAAWEGRG